MTQTRAEIINFENLIVPSLYEFTLQGPNREITGVGIETLLNVEGTLNYFNYTEEPQEINTWIGFQAGLNNNLNFLQMIDQDFLILGETLNPGERLEISFIREAYNEEWYGFDILETRNFNLDMREMVHIDGVLIPEISNVRLNGYSNFKYEEINAPEPSIILMMIIGLISIIIKIKT